MFASDRDSGVAAFGIGLSVCLAFTLVMQWSYYSSQQRQGYAEQRCAAQQLDYAKRGRLASGDVPQPSVPEKDTKGKQGGNGDEPDWCDLAAQESMAQSTNLLVTPAWWGLIFSLVGLVLLTFTLRYSRRAAEAATEGLKEARRSADASVRAADVERGFIFAHPALHWSTRSALHGEWNPRYASAYCSIKNYGRSPIILRNVECVINPFDASLEPDNTLPMDQIEFPAGYVIEPGDVWQIPQLDTQLFSEEEYEPFVSRRMFVWYYGCINYEDVFGAPRLTRFRWRSDGFAEAFAPIGGPPYNERT